MSHDFDALGAELVSVLAVLATGLAMLWVAAGVVAAGMQAPARLRSARRRRRAPRRDAIYYVGRFEGPRAVVWVVDRDGLRLLIEVFPAPACWAQVSRPLAGVMAADALPGRWTRRGRRRLARRLRRQPLDGFVLEGRRVRALAASPTIARRAAENLPGEATRPTLAAAAARPALGPGSRRHGRRRRVPRGVAARPRGSWR